MTTMEPNERRARIRAKIGSGLLPRNMSPAGMVVSPTGSGQMCAGCDTAITPSDETPVRYMSGERTYWFHIACDEIWQEERHRPS